MCVCHLNLLCVCWQSQPNSTTLAGTVLNWPLSDEAAMGDRFHVEIFSQTWTNTQCPEVRLGGCWERWWNESDRTRETEWSLGTRAGPEERWWLLALRADRQQGPKGRQTAVRHWEWIFLLQKKNSTNFCQHGIRVYGSLASSVQVVCQGTTGVALRGGQSGSTKCTFSFEKCRSWFDHNGTISNEKIGLKRKNSSCLPYKFGGGEMVQWSKHNCRSGFETWV